MEERLPHPGLSDFGQPAHGGATRPSNACFFPETLHVRAWWGLLLAGLTACEPEPRGPAQVAAPEAFHFETQHIRREVDRYKDAPSPATRRKMEQAFAMLDARLSEMETQALALTGEAQAGLQRQIANLKLRRELHWTRAQEAAAMLGPVEKALPVGEQSGKVIKARPANAAQTAQRPRARRVYRQQTPQQPQINIFQSIGRFFHR